MRDDFTDFEETMVAFHGLRTTGALEKGNLEARARFAGYRWANWISIVALALLLGWTILLAWQGRCRRAAGVVRLHRRTDTHPGVAETDAWQKGV
jgi:hypothetical protein